MQGEYLQTHGTNYTYDTLLTLPRPGCLARKKNICLKQHKNSRNTDSPLLFIDTDMYVMKVWCEFVFGKCHSWILNQIINRKYDLYLLCNVDLPWVKDDLREYPGPCKKRKTIPHIYKDIMINQAVPLG